MMHLYALISRLLPTKIQSFRFHGKTDSKTQLCSSKPHFVHFGGQNESKTRFGASKPYFTFWSPKLNQNTWCAKMSAFKKFKIPHLIYIIISTKPTLMCTPSMNGTRTDGSGCPSGIRFRIVRPVLNFPVRRPVKIRPVSKIGIRFQSGKWAGSGSD